MKKKIRSFTVNFACFWLIWSAAPCFADAVETAPARWAYIGAHGLVPVVDGGRDRVVNLQGQFMPVFDTCNEQGLANHRKQEASGIWFTLLLYAAAVPAFLFMMSPFILIALVILLPLYLIFRRKSPDRRRK